MQDKGGHDAKFLASYEIKQNSCNTRLSAVLNLIQFQMVNLHVKKIFTKVFIGVLLKLRYWMGQRFSGQSSLGRKCRTINDCYKKIFYKFEKSAFWAGFFYPPHYLSLFVLFSSASFWHCFNSVLLFCVIIECRYEF